MENRICKLLGIEKPVISAAMTWITNAEFVAAVSEAGGAGVIGFNAGQTVPTADPVETAERLRGQIKKVRELTDKPFGVNFMFGPEIDPFSAETLKVLKEDKPDFLLTISMMPLNPEVVETVKELGIPIIHRPLSPTVEDMLEAQKLGVDALIDTGFEAGGHTSNYDISLVSGFPSIRENIEIPLIAAGGIVNGAGAGAAKAMGAEGIYAGTRFIVTKENPTAAEAKQLIIDTKAEDLIQVPCAIGSIRVVPNETGLEMKRLFDNGATGPEIAEYYEGRGAFYTGMLLGKINEGIINTSEAINSITSMKTCKEVVEELAKPFEE